MFDWHDYDKIRLDQPHPATLRHEHILRYLEELHSLNPSGMRLEAIGKSYEGREIRCATVGWGGTQVLAWSQMHGNEPTHTAVLLDLLNLLQRYPEHESAHTILKGCTLHCVPMLNPDGAERYTRRNAQEIDINRDALQLQSPEGRILHDLVLRLRPQFSFNLHNQNRLTSAGGSRMLPATISLLVPPIDVNDSQTLETLRAKQVAACFLAALPREYGDMITRYDADYMPRCFGEWVQQQAGSTVTVEAGGWPDGDPKPLGHAHFAGMIRALESIANGSYLEADASAYDSLPRSSEHNLFDLLIYNVRAIDVTHSRSCEIDLGINQRIDAVDPENIRAGWIEDLGDLSVTGGIRVLDGLEFCCSPGSFRFLEQTTPLNLPDLEEVSALLAAGVTSAIGRIDLTNATHLEQLVAWDDEFSFPLNLGFVAEFCPVAPSWEQMAVCQELLLGFIAEETDHGEQLTNTSAIPLVTPEQLNAAGKAGVDPAHLANLLGCTDRAGIGLRFAADLVLRRKCGSDGDSSTLLSGEVDKVLIAGGIAYETDKIKNNCLGRLLKRTARG